MVDGSDTMMYVMPSSSARCTQLPRAVDKVPFYVALRKLRDHIRGQLPYLTENEVTFSSVLITAPRKNGQNGGKTIAATVVMAKSELLEDGNDLDNGLDEEGRPKLTGRAAFNLSLVKMETKDDSYAAAGEEDEKPDAGSIARHNIAAVIGHGTDARRSSTPATTDLSEFFVDPVLSVGVGAAPPHTSTSVSYLPPNGFVTMTGVVGHPAASSLQDGDQVHGETGGKNGANPESENGNGDQQQNESNGDPIAPRDHFHSMEHGHSLPSRGDEQHAAMYGAAYGQQLPPSVPYHSNGQEYSAGVEVSRFSLLLWMTSDVRLMHAF